MIDILVVEDDIQKVGRIRVVIDDALIGVDFEIVVVATVFDAGQQLSSRQFDLMILDIKLPMRNGQDPRDDGGAVLLEQISGRKEYKVPIHVIGLTAHEDIHERFNGLFSDLTWALVAYKPESDHWRQLLVKKLNHINNSQKVGLDDEYQTCLGVVTALERPELEAVLSLPANWCRQERLGDDTIYHVGKFTGEQRELNVVAASAIQMGMPATCALAMKMCQQYRPRYIAIVGIAAGVRGNMGDILFADRTWDYGSGKIRPSGFFTTDIFEPAPSAIPIDASLLEKFQSFSSRDEVLRRIEIEWDGPATGKRLSVHRGPIASGAAVLENRAIIETIKTRDRKLIGVEMEAYGLFLASVITPSPKPKAICIKSICDFGDPKKSDDFQAYAAYTSSRYLYEFALAEL